MNHSMQDAPRGLIRASERLAEAATDLANGAMWTARVLVTLSGAVALVAAAAILAQPDVRARVAEQIPTLSAALWPDWGEVAQAQAASADEPRPSAAPAASDEAQQVFMTQYLSRRYRVAESATRVLVGSAFEAGRELDLDPTLILAVMAIESAMNPLAESPMGAQGLMQVMTSVHAEKFEEHGGHHAALDPIANIKVGSRILKDLIRRGGSVERGLQLYVGAGNLPDDGGYGARVLGERSRIVLAGTGRVDAAIVAAIRAHAERAAAVQRASLSSPSPEPSAAGAGAPRPKVIDNATPVRPVAAADKAA